MLRQKWKYWLVGFAAIALTGVGIAAGVAFTGSSSSAVAADVPFQSYGVTGHPSPRFIADKAQDPSIVAVRLVPSKNPYEIAQQLLWLATGTTPFAREQLNLNEVWTGAIVLPPGTVLYHAPVGSRQFTPVNPSNNGKAGKLAVPSGDVALVRYPRILHTEWWAPGWIVATLATDTARTGRATDIKQDYWLKAPSDAVFKRLDFGRSHFTTGDAAVGSDGNLRLGTVPMKQLSVIQIMKRSSLKKTEAKLGLVPAPPLPSDQPPQPTG